MKPIKSEIKLMVGKVKKAQSQFQDLLKSHDWVEEAREYAERQGKEIKTLFAGDVEKMKSFLEKERKELEKFQKQIPSEVKKFKKFIGSQKKDFEKLLKNVKKMSIKPKEESLSAKKTQIKKKIKKKVNSVAKAVSGE